ncbi:glycosyltransferase family 4 protein [Phenylobacterium parvum]|uniref:Glycosyl transferase family 1 n=1 Tax=Phenylobacterium parvum TaxID=2201350 RepID=A0A2Z3I0G6_9CAUL|nr:glycosyltransferase family 4 protein [Phenylobacterium parvum]AWM78860.1 glycosyl transferase family 1 [Phenylobacterium parvum]
MKTGSRLAIYHPPGRIGLKSNPFGKDVANLQLYQALARHGGYGRIDLLSNLPVADADVAADLFPEGRAPCQVAGGSILSTEAAAEGGVLFRGQPDLDALAWIRRKATGDRGYSLVGLIHTLAPPAMRQIIAGALTSPVQAWDAVICTSPAVRDALSNMFDGWGDFLGERFGGDLRPRPQLPVIPLGVPAQEIREKADRPGARARVRSDLGIEADEALVVWVGRMSFFEKAFPQPMFRAVEEAGRLTGKRMHFALAGWFPGGEADRARYEQAAAAYAPSVQVDFQDGNDPEVVADLWAAGDIFLSLVDNIQETFGITPLEAMAAGLPVVASDWDGYRFTVRHGSEGFLIPTLGGPPGALGEALAARHAIGLDSYQTFVGAVAQHTAVHVGKAAEAIAELTRNPDLRRRMGAAGRARARETFDWPVVVRQLTGLFEELAALRAATPGGASSHRLHPLRGDPFADFAGFASHDLGLERRLRLRPGAGPDDLVRAAAVDLDGAFRMWRAPTEDAAALVGRLAETGDASVRDLLLGFPVERRRAVQMSLVWLAKIGVVDWLPPQA